MEFSTRVNSSGTAAAQGKVWPLSGAADTEITVDSLELRGFQPWIEPHLKLAIETGVVRLKGRVKAAPSSSANPELRFTGSLGVRELATVDQVLAKEFVRWDDLAVDGIDLALQPSKASVREVTLAGLRTSIIIDGQKRLNLLAVLPARATNSPALSGGAPVSSPPAPSSPAAPLSFELGELKLQKTSLVFRDESIHPACAFDLQQLDGTIKGLSTDPNSSASVALSGRVDDSAPFALHGRINPLARDLALQLAFTNHNLQLAAFTPYMEKYAGHPLNKGRLSLDLNYDVQGTQLRAQNIVRIDQLILGPRNNSPDATQLPVKLAVALLKDTNGRIDLDLPVEGRLDDPEFSVGRIILKVVGNLIAKAVAAPFKLLGALVGGGEELSFIDFTPGAAQLLDSETNKLAKLIQALEKRPALSLEIEGSVDPHVDRDTLARALVKDHVRLQRLQELSSLGQTPPSAENLQVEPANYDRILRTLVVKVCGTNLAEALRVVAERAAAATNAPAAPARIARGPGLLARLGSLFKPGKERAATRQAHQAAKADALLLEQNPELGQLTTEQMEILLAAKTEVPPETLRQLMQDRAKTVQSYLLEVGKLPAERFFLVAPKTPDPSFQGDSRAHLALQ